MYSPQIRGEQNILAEVTQQYVMQDHCADLPGPCEPSGGDITLVGAIQPSQVLESQQSGLCSTSGLSQSMSASLGATQDQDASQHCSQADPPQKSNSGPRSAMSMLTTAGNRLLGASPPVILVRP
jgi:hypothetical protein